MNDITSAGTVHRTDRLGAGGYVTMCRVVVKKSEAKPARVYYDAKGPRDTQKYGRCCAICYKEQE